MVVSTAQNAKTVVIVGATGRQGGSVVDHLIASDHPYRLHRLTRDPTKPGAQALARRGVSIFKADAADPASLEAAFRGADVVFGVTSFYEGMNAAKEEREGRTIVEACVATRVPLFVWSGLPDVSTISGGRYKHVGHFDNKARVTEYAKECGVPTAVVHAGGYAENIEGFIPITKAADGVFELAIPVPGSTLLPIIHCKRDYGAYVRAAIETPALGAGCEIFGAREYVSYADQIQIWGEVNGVPTRFVQLSDEDFLKRLPNEDVLEMFHYFQDFGCELC